MKSAEELSILIYNSFHNQIKNQDVVHTRKERVIQNFKSHFPGIARTLEEYLRSSTLTMMNVAQYTRSNCVIDALLIGDSLVISESFECGRTCFAIGLKEGHKVRYLSTVQLAEKGSTYANEREFVATLMGYL